MKVKLTQEQKNLIFKDLCSRLSYSVYVETERYSFPVELRYLTLDKMPNVRPYLRPMSSMTEEEDNEWQYYKNAIAESCDELLEKRTSELHDWFCKKHLDYRGLIPMGLALEAPADMYDFK